MTEPTGLDALFNKENGRTLLKLVIASAVVGALMSFFGLKPLDILEGLGETVRTVYENLNAIVSEVVTWVILGATVVVPIWLLVSLPRRFKRHQKALPPSEGETPSNSGAEPKK